MNLELLRKVIREEVKKAFQEELKEVLQEAVKIASTPKKETVVNQQYAGKPITYEHTSPIPGVDPVLSKLLSETKNEMTPEEYRTVFEGNTTMGVQKPNFASMMATNMGMKYANEPVDLGDNRDHMAGGSGVNIASLGLDRMKKVFQASLANRNPNSWGEK